MCIGDHCRTVENEEDTRVVFKEMSEHTHVVACRKGGAKPFFNPIIQQLNSLCIFPGQNKAFSITKLIIMTSSTFY